MVGRVPGPVSETIAHRARRVEVVTLDRVQQGQQDLRAPEALCPCTATVKSPAPPATFDPDELKIDSTYGFSQPRDRLHPATGPAPARHLKQHGVPAHPRTKAPPRPRPARRVLGMPGEHTRPGRRGLGHQPDAARPTERRRPMFGIRRPSPSLHTAAAESYHPRPRQGPLYDLGHPVDDVFTHSDRVPEGMSSAATSSPWPRARRPSSWPTSVRRTAESWGGHCAPRHSIPHRNQPVAPPCTQGRVVGGTPTGQTTVGHLGRRACRTPDRPHAGVRRGTLAGPVPSPVRRTGTGGQTACSHRRDCPSPGRCGPEQPAKAAAGDAALVRHDVAGQLRCREHPSRTRRRQPGAVHAWLPLTAKESISAEESAC